MESVKPRALVQSTKRLLVTACIAAAAIGGVAVDSANAITVDGNEYEEFLSIYTKDDLGFWSKADKFFTFINNDNYLKPNRVHSVLSNDTGLRNSEIDGALFMGFTEPNETDLKSASFELRGDHGEVLLSAEYLDAGTLEATRKRGRSGNLDIAGVFAVTGGSLFDTGIVSAQIYLSVSFDYVWQNEYKDFKTRKGTYTLYDFVGGEPPYDPPHEPPTEVPEPLTVSLLFSGLIGAARVRKRS